MNSNLETYLIKNLNIFFRKTIVFLALIVMFNLYAQTTPCNLIQSQYNNVVTIDNEDIICMAKSTTKNTTILYTFAIWCKPCIASLPEAIKLSDEYNIDLYVLLIEKESDKRVKQSEEYLKNIKKDIQILVLKDGKYGLKSRKKYQQFLNEITPNEFENSDCLSKYILIDKEGRVIMVTNWKDSYFGKIQDKSRMIQQKIAPLLSQKIK